MKKLSLLFLVSFFAFSCSTSDDEACLEIWGVSNSNGEYSVEYGESENNTITVEVNQSTFNYYWGIVGDEDPDNDCWEGMK